MEIVLNFLKKFPPLFESLLGQILEDWDYNTKELPKITKDLKTLIKLNLERTYLKKTHLSVEVNLLIKRFNVKDLKISFHHTKYSVKF